MVREGWEALEWIPGSADETRVDEVVRAGMAFHRALADLPRPDFIAESNDPWSRADRIAWGEVAWHPSPVDPLLKALKAECRPVTTPGQVVHGDLLGNVLFASLRPSAIIDWAPYWRPAGYGAAVAVVDCVCWHGLPLSALADNYGIPEWRQLLLRALLFRVVTRHLLDEWDEAFSARHEPVAEAIFAPPE